jgi:hypothetical protein
LTCEIGHGGRIGRIFFFLSLSLACARTGFAAFSLENQRGLGWDNKEEDAPNPPILPTKRARRRFMEMASPAFTPPAALCVGGLDHDDVGRSDF